MTVLAMIILVVLSAMTTNIMLGVTSTVVAIAIGVVWGVIGVATYNAIAR